MNDKFHQRLSVMVRRLRKAAGLNQTELARLAGIGKTVVFDIEHRKETVQLDTLLKVLRALNVRLELKSPLAFPEDNE